MATWPLSCIKTKIRRITGRFSDDEMTDANLEDRINKFYQYTFPAEVKLERNHVFYNFLTLPNQAYYTAPEEFTNFEPPAMLNGNTITWYQDPIEFFRNSSQQITYATQWTGDGVTAVFGATVSSIPIYPGTLVITDNVESFQDLNLDWTTVVLPITGTLGGTATVDYANGDITVGFTSPPALGQKILVSYTPFTPSIPYSVLWYNNYFQFDPVPDTAYRFVVKAYQSLPALVNATDRPLLDQWGPCIAYGTARDIHADYSETDAYAEVSELYKEQVAYVLNRTSQNLLNTRAVPDF